MHPDGYRASHEDVPDRVICDALNYTWENAEVHFDHVGMAYLALFQVATWKGWITIMNDAIDTTAVSIPYLSNYLHVCYIIASSLSFKSNLVPVKYLLYVYV